MHMQTAVGMSVALTCRSQSEAAGLHGNPTAVVQILKIHHHYKRKLSRITRSFRDARNSVAECWYASLLSNTLRWSCFSLVRTYVRTRRTRSIDACSMHFFDVLGACLATCPPPSDTACRCRLTQFLNFCFHSGLTFT